MATDEAIESLTNELRALTVRKQQVELELRALREHATEPAPAARRPVAFISGDRVRIINKVIKPSNWLKRWDSNTIEAERRATVTHTVRDQVWIRTDNETKTWRAPNILKRLD